MGATTDTLANSGTSVNNKSKAPPEHELALAPAAHTPDSDKKVHGCKTRTVCSGRSKLHMVAIKISHELEAGIIIN